MQIAQSAPTMIILLLASACGAADGSGVQEDQQQASALFIDPGPNPGPGNCDDSNPCTIDLATSYGCRYYNVPDGTACPDSNQCDGTETCRSGICRAGTPLNCNDGNPCTDDSCSRGLGCQNVPNTNPCNDGSACSVADQCRDGVCRGLGSTSGPMSVPLISDVSTSAPAPSEVLSRGEVHYLEGDKLDISFTVSSCSYVTGVKYAGRTLDTRPHLDCDDVNGYDCERNYYTIEGDVLNADNTRRLTLRLHLYTVSSLVGRGTSSLLEITATSALGEATETMRVSRVADVNPEHTEISYSENELKNRFVGGFYEEFGDFNQFDANGWRIYGHDYSKLKVDIDSSGVRVRTEFKVEVPGWCDPTAKIDGRFRIVKDNLTLVPDWVHGPDVDLDQAWYCDLTIVGAIGLWVAEFFVDDIVAKIVDDQFRSQIDEMLEDCGALCVGLISDVITVTDEMRVLAEPRFPTVAIDVPYDAERLESPGSNGVAVASGQSIVAMASRLVTGCSTPGSSRCEGKSMGPRGLFNWRLPSDAPAGPPVPTPWPDSGAYYRARQEARSELQGFSRLPDDLPRSDLRVGALLVGKSSEAPFIIREVSGGPCQVNFPSFGHAAFGPNDVDPITSAVAGSGTYRVYLSFVSGDLVPVCN